MTIKTITVGNYKNIALTTLNCPHMLALVSPNNYGKSNMLEAIRFGLDFLSASSKTRNAMMRHLPRIPLSPSLAGKDFTFSIEFDEPSLGQYRYMRYGYQFSWYNDQGTGAKITNESIELRPNESVKYTSYLKRGDGKFRPSKSTSSFRKLKLRDDALAIDAIELISGVEISDALKALKKLGYRLCNALELDDSFIPSPFAFEGLEVDASFGNEDIPQMIAMLKAERPDLYSLYIETIYDLFPEFRRIELQKLTMQESTIQKLQAFMVTEDDGTEKKTEIPYHIRNDIYRLIVESDYLNQPISMEYMSTGTKRIFWLIANAVVSEYRNINLLGIDEVETSIHPRMLRGLLESLDELLGKTSMIVTSHSPYLIQYLKPEWIYIGVPHKDGVATFRRIQRSKVKLLLKAARGLEMSIGEYLFDLMSGDEDSIQILSAYLED